MEEITTLHTSSKTEYKMTTLIFEPLHYNGTNFTKWNMDAQTYLNAENIAKTLDFEDNTEVTHEVLPPTARWHALMILQRHLEPVLQIQYMHIRDPTSFWAELNTRFGDQEMLYLPQAKADMTNMRVLEFPNFSVYDKELQRIVAKLWVCGERVTNGEIIKKIFSTFSTTSAPLAQNMRYMKIKKYARLMQQLLLAETQHQTLVKNNEIRPPREIHNT